MRREVVAYLIVGALVAIGVLLLYSVGVEFTGLAVFQQQTQIDFDEGDYSNVVYDANASAIILDVNQTSGTYTSKFFDASEEAIWNNLTWTGQGDLGFEVRACTSSDCANESFASADLNDLNLTAQYFQYRVLFTEDPNLTVSLESVSIDYSVPEAEPAPENVTVSVSEPAGTKSSETGIPIQFSATGENITCWYNVLEGGSIVIENTTLDNCTDSSFDVSDEGTYSFNLYVNNSLGDSDSQSSTFVVSIPPPSSSESDEESTTEEAAEGSFVTGEATTEFVETIKLTAGEIQSLTMNPNETRGASWTVKNVWNFPLQECNFESIGEFYSWINYTETKTLDAGEEHTFVFDISVPEETELGEYGLGVSLKCPGAGKSTLFTVDVVEKKLDFVLISAVRDSESSVSVTYSLEELSGNDQDVEITFSLLDSDNREIAKTNETQSISADSIEEFRTSVPIDESLLPVNESTNETLETELRLLIDLNSEIYSVSVQEKITIGAPIGGFAIFGEGGLITGNIMILVVFVLVLGIVFFVVRKLRKGIKKSSG